MLEQLDTTTCDLKLLANVLARGREILEQFEVCEKCTKPLKDWQEENARGFRHLQYVEDSLSFAKDFMAVVPELDSFSRLFCHKESGAERGVIKRALEFYAESLRGKTRCSDNKYSPDALELGEVANVLIGLYSQED